MIQIKCTIKYCNSPLWMLAKIRYHQYKKNYQHLNDYSLKLISLTLYLKILDGTWDCFGHFWNLCPVEVCLKSYRKKRVNVIEMQYTKELTSMCFVHFNEHLLSSIRWSLIHRLSGRRRELFCCSSNCIASNLNVVCNAWNLHGIYMVN